MKNRIILAIKGVGTAGSARLRALGELPHFELAGICSRRKEVQTRSWEEVLADPQVGAVAISTENTDHEQSVREALKAGKHVLCDYPLAFTAQAIRELYELAKMKQRVLHVEHIALLSASHLWVKNQIQKLGKLKQGNFSFIAGWNEKLADESKQGDFVYLMESRLLQLADWFGDFSLQYKVRYPEHLFTADLDFLQGGKIHFEERRQEGAKRSRKLELEMEQGIITWPNLEEKESLFKKDLEHFFRRITHGAKNYYEEGLMKKIIGELQKH